MVRGGSPKETELTAREREICQRLGPHCASVDCCLSAST